MLSIEDMHREPKSVIRFKWIHYIVYSFIALVLVTCIYFILREIFTTAWNYAIFLIPILMLAFSKLASNLRYSHTAYNVESSTIEVCRGIYFHSREIIPVDRIQFVEVRTGRIAKRFNLAKVVIHTSGSTIDLLYIPQKQASELQTQIINRVKEVTLYV